MTTPSDEKQSGTMQTIPTTNIIPVTANPITDLKSGDSKETKVDAPKSLNQTQYLQLRAQGKSEFICDIFQGNFDQEIQFAGCDLDHADFTQAQFKAVNFVGSSLHNIWIGNKTNFGNITLDCKSMVALYDAAKNANIDLTNNPSCFS
jgi:uncharacterized protein YjbI with pentapeptide repeats